MGNDEVQTVYELKAKVDGLMQWARDTGQTSLASLRAIEKLTRLSYSTLQSSMNVNGSTLFGRISVANQKILADSFKFNIAWPEWRDPSATRETAVESRRDRPEKFLARFREYKSIRPNLTIQDGTTKTRADSRFAYFAFTIDGLHKNSTSFDGIPLGLSLSFDERGWSVFPDLVIQLKTVDVLLRHQRDGATIEAYALDCRDETEGNFCGQALGLRQRPYWVISPVEGSGTSLSGRRSRNSGHDCVCRGFQAGDEIIAAMRARVSDFHVETIGDTTFAHVSKGKDRVIKHLAKLSALENKSEAILAEQVLTVVEKL